MRVLLFTFFCWFSGPTFGGEFFECKDLDPNVDWTEIVVSLYTGDDDISPSVRVPPVTIRAIHTIVGTVKRWDYPSHAIEEGLPGFAILVAPSGKAEFYDFSRDAEGSNTSPHRLFDCRLVPDYRPSGPPTKQSQSH